MVYSEKTNTFLDYQSNSATVLHNSWCPQHHVTDGYMTLFRDDFLDKSFLLLQNALKITVLIEQSVTSNVTRKFQYPIQSRTTHSLPVSSFV